MASFAERYGDWALVLGASEGLGGALATEAARRGLNVAMVARREPVLKAKAEEIANTFGVQTKTIVADMADPDVIGVLERGLGGVEPGFMIYNCAAEHGGEFLNVDLEKQRQNITVNCWTPVQLAHHFGGKMCARGRGGLVICSSLAGEQGIYHWASYGAAKAFEMILGEGLWYEFKLKGVDCTSFMIGSTYTPNFQRDQRAKNSIFAETNRPANLPEGVPIPQLPEEAAHSLFEQLQGAWKPRTYANPADEARCQELAKQPRERVINRMSDSQRLGWQTMADKKA